MKENYIINNLGTFISKTYFSFVVKIRIFILNFLYSRTIKEIKEAEEYYYFYKFKNNNNSNAVKIRTLDILQLIFKKNITLFFALYNDRFYNQMLELEIISKKEGKTYLEIEDKYGLEKIQSLSYKVNLIYTAIFNIKDSKNINDFFDTFNFILKNFYSYKMNFNEVKALNSKEVFEYRYKLLDYFKTLKNTSQKLSNQDKVKKLKLKYEEFNSEIREFVKFNSLDVIYVYNLRCILEANLIKKIDDLNLFFKNEFGKNYEKDFFNLISNKISSNKKLLKLIGRIEKMGYDYKHYYFELDSVYPIYELIEYEFNIPLDEGLEIIKQAFAPMGKEYLTKLYQGINISYNNIKKISSNNFIFENSEAYIKYDNFLKDYIIHVNYNPKKISSLFALAHELGHYCDSSVQKTTKSAVEINSKLAEYMLYNYLKETKKDDIEFMLHLKYYMYSEIISKLKLLIKNHFTYLLTNKVLTCESKESINESVLSKLYFETLEKYWDNHHVLIGNTPSAYWIWEIFSNNHEYLSHFKYILGDIFSKYLVENFKNEEFQKFYLDNFLNSNIETNYDEETNEKIDLKYYMDSLELEDMEKVITSYINFVEIEISSLYTLLNRYRTKGKK